MLKTAREKGIIFMTLILFWCLSTITSVYANETDELSADVIIETSLGNIELKLFPELAPGHVENFIKLAKSGFYDGTIFHRIIPGFMIQGGDPNSKETDRASHGAGGPGYAIDAEFNDRSHVRGVLSMARSSNPNSAGSQFFIVVKKSIYLDNKYTIFGEVVCGMEVVDEIVSQQRDGRDNPIERIEMTIRTIEIEKNVVEGELEDKQHESNKEHS